MAPTKEKPRKQDTAQSTASSSGVGAFSNHKRPVIPVQGALKRMALDLENLQSYFTDTVAATEHNFLTRIASLETENTDLESRVLSHGERLCETVKNVKELQATNRHLTNKTTAQDINIKHLTAEKTVLETNVAEQQITICCFRADNAKLIDRTKEQEREFFQLEKDHATYRLQQKDQGAEIKTQYNKIEKLIAEKGELEERLERKEDRIKRLATGLSDMEDKSEEQESKMEELEEQVHKDELRIARLLREAEEKESETAEKQSRIEELEREMAAEKAKDKDSEDAKKRMSAMKRKFNEMAELFGGGGNAEEVGAEAESGQSVKMEEMI